MIMRFLDWSENNGGFGVFMFIFVSTIMCATGLAFIVLAIDFINEDDKK